MPVIAMYLRLSQEDRKSRNTRDESNSISSQRMLIKEYIYNNAVLKNYDIIEFCDDGYSGTSMDRPGMAVMLNQVKQNRIDCIIVKDLSRFSRDYIELGTYMEQVFPFMGVRFIAVNDNYDSSSHNGSIVGIDTGFKALMYDFYSKDISAKVKTSLANKFSRGEYAYGQVPFGYQKSSTVKNGVEVNQKEAEVVRYIFALAAQGRSSVQIAKQLYKEGIPAIQEFRNRKPGYNGRIYTWNYSAVRRILSNRFYLGEMAYGKSIGNGGCGRSRIKVPEKEWKVIKYHHEPLVSVETFNNAAYTGQVHNKKYQGVKHPLAGKLYCGGCGYAMGYKKAGKYSKYSHFWCRKHSLLQIPECCTMFNADILEVIVITMLKRELDLRADIVRQKENILLFYQQCAALLKKQAAGYKKDKKQAQAEKDWLYEKYALGGMSKERYKEEKRKLEERISSAIIMAGKEQDKLLYIEGLAAGAGNGQIINCLKPGRISQEIADIFIKRINVYKDKRVEIQWTFSEKT